MNLELGFMRQKPEGGKYTNNLFSKGLEKAGKLTYQTGTKIGGIQGVYGFPGGIGVGLTFTSTVLFHASSEVSPHHRNPSSSTEISPGETDLLRQARREKITGEFIESSLHGKAIPYELSSNVIIYLRPNK